MKRGRPTKHDRSKIKKSLQSYYQKGISASVTAKASKINYKTVLKYFAEWDKEILELEDKDFLRRTKITKEKTLQVLDDEMISLENHEKEVNTANQLAKKIGDITSFVKLSQLKLKMRDQKLRIVSSKINLINTPTAGEIIKLENKDD